MQTTHYNRFPLSGDYFEGLSLGTDNLCETIRAIVREELRKLVPSPRHQVDSIVDVVREEVRQSLGIPETPQAQPEAMSYASATRLAAATPRPRQDRTPQQFRRRPWTPPRPLFG